MISLRLSEDEYRELRSFCRESGTRSLSDLARVGMRRVMSELQAEKEPLQSRLEALDQRLRALESKLYEK